MTEVVTVELRLIEQIFRLSTTTNQKADLERAGQLLNEKFQEFRRKAPNMEHNKLMIMVALELMQEILTMNKSLQEYSHCERLLSTMLEDVEKAV
ncbi:cell division protein ZapA [Acinetobacter sp. ANC 4648]|uniref:cell division protein ZapA n=1 Tax=Acinetobacter sp. ANC 4648 TaxID=1977875 RepID=UPI000A33C144|nr:cell division protein ZapA [Acinetobacter sp. ANC 4648]OTG81720.1 cell division protein ZapA [Acinetobacter sp. ANC 4648]